MSGEFSQRWRRFRKSYRTWDSDWLPLGAGTLAGAFLGLAVASIQATARGLTPFAQPSPWGPIAAFLFGFVAVAVPLFFLQHLAGRIAREARALVNVRPLTGGDLLGTDAWAMDAVFGQHILHLIDEGAEHVVELGSGRSTLLIARRLEERGRGRVVAVDHLAEFADRTRRWIEEHGLGHRATVVHAPLVERDVDGRRVRWYDPGPLDGALPAGVDLLIVDGPPDATGPDARWPAVPALAPRLSPGAVVLLDDGDRRAERRAARDWHRRLGGRMDYLVGPKGGWRIRTPQ